MLAERKPKMLPSLKNFSSTISKQPTRRSFLEGGALLLIGSAGHLALADDALPAARLFGIERVS
jgi:hypothetical protein